MESLDKAPDIAQVLTPVARLALAYAPSRLQDDWLRILALDSRLSMIVAQAREPALAQLRLAWWRESLGGQKPGQGRGEPLVAALASWNPEALVALVDGWEWALTADPFDQADAESFACGRATAMAELAQRFGCDEAGAVIRARRWAFSELSLSLAAAEGRELARNRALAVPPTAHPCPRAMRPLAVLEALHMKAVARRAASALNGPGDLLTALRAGLFA